MQPSMKRTPIRWGRQLQSCISDLQRLCYLSLQPINKVRFSHFEKAIVGSVCEDGSVCLWSVESQRLLTKMTPSHLGKWEGRREGGRRGGVTSLYTPSMMHTCNLAYPPCPHLTFPTYSFTIIYSLTPSHAHILTCSHPHMLTPLLLTPSHAHILTCSLLTCSHPQSSHPHMLTPSHPHMLTSSHPHMLTSSHPHTSHPHMLTSSHRCSNRSLLLSQQ